MNIRETLYALAEPDYQKFQSKLIPTIPPERILGVRIPKLRQLAKELRGTPAAEDFLRHLPHTFYEEDCLHGLLICMERDYGQTVTALERLLPYIDNWASCDLLSPAAFRAHPAELPQLLYGYLQAEHLYTLRFGLGCLMKYYLDQPWFCPEYLSWAAAVQTEEYYGQMMIAWYFATALSKQYDAALPYLTERRLAPTVHRMTVQKAVESYRISTEQKQFLKTLRERKRENA